MKILISAYACGPNWGSEIGMGWNWVINLSNYCELTVITESGFQNDIENVLPSLNLKFKPIFHYIDIGEKGRKLFWKQGSFFFYHHYKIWQRKAYLLSKTLVKNQKFDLIHQLNMIGFREPGYLWQIKEIPYIWGPVGGYNQIPWLYLPKLGFNNFVFFTLKNIINEVQKVILSRPKQAAKRADIVFTATKESKDSLLKYSKNVPIILNETGSNINLNLISQNKIGKKFQILWVGKIQGTKALPIALYALNKIKDQFDFNFIIVGDGPDELRCRKLSNKLKLNSRCVWKGKIPNDEVIKLMQESNIMLFTSLKEGTPHVITEALQNGLPVLCHDACGHGSVVTNNCGIKIPMKNFSESIKNFSIQIIKTIQNPNLLADLVDGSIKRAIEISWDSKAQFMVEQYKKLLGDEENN